MIETYFSVRCDECGREAGALRGEERAITYAKENGYALNVDDRGRDLCFRCANPPHGPATKGS